MRQVNEDELIWRMRYNLSRLGAGIRKNLASSNPDVRRPAEQLVAEQLVRTALARLEILSSAPLREGTNVFERAAYGEGEISIE
ncbi:hypothetical protein [Sphingomonas sp. 8AM]|uniref:hypothetical protein n=1 Tax=Sphingomonas sp. 8AM TaxID=2653170 RepID=UPI0012EFF89B|nr:hypothetical protein [Sphingomonas sp. 8AM]VXC80002.1 hypothetical protein SPHINGO8AM_220016 [Sphingomonas sp. 8AM]